ncbi:DUF4919 domain-containing protein [Chryseobacterium arthrosphaerae]|uniref:DUF4919 domain-containing protein n=1 Tax=Chryseobacterium arthrosphaerae TaxID=651561 RepID=A0A432E1G4_9FLAO|nr:DUF4919 domain-containing protein [Chryseobacterium arthrosphaerae]
MAAKVLLKRCAGRIKLFREALEENPFDLRAMNYLVYMYRLVKDENMAQKQQVIFMDY